MRFIDAAGVAAALSYPALIDTLAEAFRTGAHAPPRHHHTMTLAGRPDATLLLMPAWSAAAPGAATAGRYFGVKLVTVFPDNGVRGLPAVQGAYLLASAETGVPLALIDAPSLTTWRTAAASALASRYLSRADSSHLVMVGAGALAPYLIRAHASVRPITRVTVWNRSATAAASLAATLELAGVSITATSNLQAAVETADIVSCATLSPIPLISGAWLRPGTHLDLVGAYRPDMRESDDACAVRSRLWVDTRAGGLLEAGDIVIPLKAGLIRESDVLGDLYGLTRGLCPVRASPDDITLFKSVGASLEDLAAAIAVYEPGPDRAPSQASEPTG
jgi:alanine dehydrogenase